MRSVPTLIALAALCSPARADDIRGPITGFVFDERSAAIRPLVGLPGGAYVGDALAADVALRDAVIAPGGEFALGLDTADGQLVLVRRLREAQPEVLRLEAALRDAERIQINAAGTAALLYDRGESRVRILTGLPDRPAWNGSIEISAELGQLQALDLSQDGARVLLGLSRVESGPGMLYEAALGSQEFRPLGVFGRIVAVRFANGDRDAAVADGATQEIVLVRHLRAAGERMTLARAADGIDDLVAMAVTGEELVVANSRGSVTIVDLELRHAPTTQALPFLPTRCDPVGGGTFLLNRPDRSPLYLLDTSREHGLYFVPIGEAYARD